MENNLRKRLLEKEMTRKEFLQLAGSSMLVLFGLSNLLALINHLNKTAEQPASTSLEGHHGFGSRKFGA